MLKHYLLGAMIFGMLAPFSSAQKVGPARALNPVDNYFPEANNFEVGGTYRFSEYDDETENLGDRGINRSFWAAYGRYNMDNRLIFDLEVPVGLVDPEVGDSEFGLGDIEAGVSLKAYEDILDWDFIIPHLHVRADTGDEDDLLGNGETVTRAGFSAGTTVKDFWHFVLDASYELRSDTENAVILSGTVSYEFSRNFTALAEFLWSDEELEHTRKGDEHPAQFIGGMQYRWDEFWAISAYAGGGKNQREDVFAMLKLSYIFD